MSEEWYRSERTEPHTFGSWPSPGSQTPVLSLRPWWSVALYVPKTAWFMYRKHGAWLAWLTVIGSIRLRWIAGRIEQRTGDEVV